MYFNIVKITEVGRQHFSRKSLLFRLDLLFLREEYWIA